MESNTLGSYLKNLRKSFGYTQEYVSDYLNIIHQTYSHYETGRIIPPADSLYILAKLYHVPVESFLKMIVPTTKDLDALASVAEPETTDELSLFLKRISDSEYSNRFRYLSHSEKRMLYYYEQLTQRTQERVLDFLKIEVKYEKLNQEKPEK